MLKIDEKTLFSQETQLSKSYHDHDYFEPEWTEGLYTCSFTCTKCSDVIVSNGIMRLQEDVEPGEDGELNLIYEEVYIPKYFSPPLRIIEIPKDTPAAIKKELLKSFELFFCCPSSSLNHLRICLEELLNEIGVKRYTHSNGKRKIISLHHRIELLKKPFDDFKDYLLAVKWLGNAGSHSHSEVTMDDVMDALEIIEHILGEIYANKTKKIKTMVRNINKKKGPIKR